MLIFLAQVVMKETTSMAAGRFHRLDLSGSSAAHVMNVDPNDPS
jgi:hypothetical protein